MTETEHAEYDRESQQREARLAAGEAIWLAVRRGGTLVVTPDRAVEYALEILRWSALQPEEVASR